MTTTLRRDSRLFALLALLAALPLAIWACDAGDSPDGPSGPSSKYNPNVPYTGATITATARPSTITSTSMFTIMATFKDGNGLPVEGVPLMVYAEGAGYFSTPTNPVLTAPNGGASIDVYATNCPNGSYTFVVTPANGPNVKGYVGIIVSGAGATAPQVTVVDLAASALSVVENTPVTFTATATATSTCSVRFMYQSVGAGASKTWTAIPGCAAGPICEFDVTPLSPGTLTVMAKAYCLETPTVGVNSDWKNVTVTAAP